MNMHCGRWAACVFGLSFLQGALGANATTADASAIDGELQEVVIYACGEQLIGKAEAASEGAVGGADLSVRPLLRVAEPT